MLVFQQRVLSYMSTDKRNKVEIKQIKCGKLIMLGIERNHISNLRKPAFTAMCAVSVFYANWA
ncbi:hypothetical protein T01_3972, partial [Trichinella spiralis]